MKIDKAILVSTNDSQYLDYWETVKKAWLKLNIEPTDTDQPKIIKKKVLTTKADSPVTTLKSDNMLSTFVSSISFERPPEKKTL